jgi:hypothetical protein
MSGIDAAFQVACALRQVCAASAAFSYTCCDPCWSKEVRLGEVATQVGVDVEEDVMLET